MSDTHTTKQSNGVQLDLFNGTQLKNTGTAEKISLILDSVRAGNIVILSEGLAPEEEGQLIEKTMTQIQPDGFTGIEIETYQQESSNDGGFLGRVLNKQEDSQLTVIGPANKMKTLHKDEDILSTFVSSS